MAYIIPFNHQPVATGSQSTTYTVPSGKYSRVVVTLNAAVFMSASTSAAVANFPPSGGSQNDSVVVEIWAKAGDAISFTSSIPSAASSNSSGATDVKYLNGVTTSIAQLNGTAFAKARAAVTLITTNASGSQVTIGGSVDGNLYYEEYNVIS